MNLLSFLGSYHLSWVRTTCELMQPYRQRVGTCRYVADKLLDLLGICADANVIIEVAEEKRAGEAS